MSRIGIAIVGFGLLVCSSARAQLWRQYGWRPLQEPSAGARLTAEMEDVVKHYQGKGDTPVMTLLFKGASRASMKVNAISEYLRGQDQAWVLEVPIDGSRQEVDMTALCPVSGHYGLPSGEYAQKNTAWVYVAHGDEQEFMKKNGTYGTDKYKKAETKHNGNYVAQVNLGKIVLEPGKPVTIGMRDGSSPYQAGNFGRGGYQAGRVVTLVPVPRRVH